MSARTRFLAGPVRGRTHRSAPTRGSIREPTEICAGNGPCPNGAGQSPPPTGGAGVDRQRGAPGERRGEVTPPYGCVTGGVRQRADMGIGPYEKKRKPHQPPKPAAHSGAFAPAGARSKRESAQRPSKRGTPPRPPKQRLAKRKARKEQLVKFRFCPMTSECSTAYNAWKSQQSPARAYADITLTEQNSLGPHPAAREGAPRP